MLAARQVIVILDSGETEVLSTSLLEEVFYTKTDLVFGFTGNQILVMVSPDKRRRELYMSLFILFKELYYVRCGFLMLDIELKNEFNRILMGLFVN